MLATGAAILFSMAAMKADPLDDARKVYSNCLRTFHNAAVKEKVTIPDFREKMKTACETERASYNAAVVKSERAFGSSVKDAEAYAADEISLLVSGTTTSFADNAAAGATLVLEP